MTEEKNETLKPSQVEEQLEIEANEQVVETEVMDEEDELIDEFDQDIYIENENKEILAGVTFKDFNQLTRKNQHFMIALDRQVHDDLHFEDRGRVYKEIVETLTEGQASSQTAKQLYGTPTELAQVIRDQEISPAKQNQEQVSSDLLLGIDGALFLGSLFTFVTGMSMLLSKEPANDQAYMGLLTMILNYLVAGIAMLLTAKNLPNPDAPKGKKGYGKYFGISIVAMAIWFITVSFSVVILPRSINPILPAQVYMVIGALTFALRYYLRRKYQIKGGVF